MLINKGKKLYKFVPHWWDKQEAQNHKFKIKNEKSWITQDVKFSFNLTVPRWVWIIMSLLLILLIWS